MTLPSRLVLLTYELHFKDLALKEWKKLDASIQAQFKKKLAERLENPHVPSAKIKGGKDLYKIIKIRDRQNILNIFSYCK